jgi:hypothetical protein
MAVRRGHLGDKIVDTIEEFNKEAEPVRAWIKAAVLDGWELSPLYPTTNGPGEGEETAAKLTIGGWVCHAIKRPPGHKGTKVGRIDISVWDVEGISVHVPIPYPGLSELALLMKRCHWCHKVSDTTTRVGFASRSCSECLGKARKEVEYDGWTK